MRHTSTARLAGGRTLLLFAALSSNCLGGSTRAPLGLAVARAGAVEQPARPSTAGVGAEFFVSPSGSDSNPGTLERPFATLERAQAAVRRLKASEGLPPGGVAVTVRGGTYPRTTALALTSADSGAADRPVIFRAHRGEAVRVLGGKVIPPLAFVQVTSSDPMWSRLAPEAQAGGGRIWKVGLKAVGIPSAGVLQKRGWDAGATGSFTVEPFFDGAAMRLARWPDPDARDVPGHVRGGMALTAKASDPDHVAYRGALPARWSRALAKGQVWIHAWPQPWASQHLRVASARNGLFTLSGSLPYGGIPGADFPYYVENLIEEITVPGEWTIDRSEGVLYLWPPATPLSQHEVVISTASSPLLTVTRASHVQLEGITFEASRVDLVRIDAGSSHVSIERCVIRNGGGRGVVLEGHDNRIARCEISGTGAGSVEVSGGAYRTLTPGNQVVEDSHIHDSSRWDFRPAIMIRGVGNRVAHNHLHDGPAGAIQFEGNDHLIAYNDVHHFLKWNGDGGAIYSGRNGTWRGNEVKFNFIRNLMTWFDPATWAAGIGVYLDDMMSSVHVFGNVFMDIHGVGILHAGGRDSVMENNLFVRCGSHALYTKASGRSDDDARQILEYPQSYAQSASLYTSRTWAKHPAATWAGVNPYAALAALGRVTSLTTPPMRDGYANWRHPGGNVWARNVGWRIGEFDSEREPGTCFKYFKEYGTPGKAYSTAPPTNAPDMDPRFVDEADLRRGLRPDSPVPSIPGWSPIPFGEVGIR